MLYLFVTFSKVRRTGANRKIHIWGSDRAPHPTASPEFGLWNNSRKMCYFAHIVNIDQLSSHLPSRQSELRILFRWHMKGLAIGSHHTKIEQNRAVSGDVRKRANRVLLLFFAQNRRKSLKSHLLTYTGIGYRFWCQKWNI